MLRKACIAPYRVYSLPRNAQSSGAIQRAGGRQAERRCPTAFEIGDTARLRTMTTNYISAGSSVHSGFPQAISTYPLSSASRLPSTASDDALAHQRHGPLPPVYCAGLIHCGRDERWWCAAHQHQRSPCGCRPRLVQPNCTPLGPSGAARPLHPKGPPQQPNGQPLPFLFTAAAPATASRWNGRGRTALGQLRRDAPHVGQCDEGHLAQSRRTPPAAKPSRVGHGMYDHLCAR